MDDSKPTSTTEKEEELSADYANNVLIEQTIWDIKLIFGEYSGRLNSVEWHTSVTLPWAQAKLLAYYLQINIAFREMHEGPIKIPDPVIPELPPPLTAEQEKDPAMLALRKFIEEQREMYFKPSKGG